MPNHVSYLLSLDLLRRTTLFNHFIGAERIIFKKTDVKMFRNKFFHKSVVHHYKITFGS